MPENISVSESRVNQCGVSAEMCTRSLPLTGCPSRRSPVLNDDELTNLDGVTLILGMLG